jgi:hypothetical protein
MALATAALNESLSDSINLFQAIHVLQGKEDEMAYKKNETSSCKPSRPVICTYNIDGQLARTQSYDFDLQRQRFKFLQRNE